MTDSKTGTCESGVYVVPLHVENEDKIDLVTSFGAQVKDDQAKNCNQRYEIRIYESNPDRKYEFIPAYSKEWIAQSRIIVISESGMIVGSGSLTNKESKTILEKSKQLIEEINSNQSSHTTPASAPR